MISLEKKINDIINERAILLSSRLSLESNLDEALEERNFLFKYLTNNTNDKGIVDLLSALAKELNYLTGANFNSPNLLSNQSGYSSSLLNKLIEASSGAGDGSIYPDASATSINTNSSWIKNNGISGNDYSTSTFKTTYDSLISNLNLLRTERQEQTAPFPGEPLEYVQRDYYDNQLKQDIESGLSSLISIINTLKNNYTTVIENIVNNYETNEYLKEPDIGNFIESSYFDFSNNLDSFKTNLQNILNYLSPIGPSDDCSSDPNYNRSTFDERIGFDSQGTYYKTLSTIENGISSRVTSLMKNFNGTLTGNIREWYIFWINLLIGRPSATIISHVGLSKALNDTTKSLTDKKSQLELLFGDDYDKYLPTPEIVSVFKDEEGRTNILVNSLPCFSKIKIYRKEVELTDTLKNNIYASANVIDEINVSEPKLIFLDLDELNENSIYSYRAVIQDNSIIDSYYSGSQQSKVLEDNIAFTLEDSNTLNLGEHNFSAGHNIYISGEGIFRIIGKTSTTIIVDREVLNNGNLRKANGLLFT